MHPSKLFSRDNLISPAYLEEQRILHADPKGYGGRGSKWASLISSMILHHKCKKVLDYGCGQGTLWQAVKEKTSWPMWTNYDPAFPPFDAQPIGDFDLVVCTDVLEHIEEDKIFAVLGHLRALTADSGVLFTVISLVGTAKRLSDGRDAHILLRPETWWEVVMRQRGFECENVRWHNPKPEKQFVRTWRPI